MNRATVDDYMTRDVVVLRPEDGFKEAVRALADRGISGAPVVDPGGRVMGLVSEADLLPKEASKAVPKERRRFFPGRRLRAMRIKERAGTAADVMSRPAVTVTTGTPLVKAARLMAERGIKRLPVVGADGMLVGIISRADVMGVFLAPDQQIREDVIGELTECGLCADPARIHVEVTDGTVTLGGRLTKDLVPIAVALTRSVDGVVGVIDELSPT